MSHIEFTYGRQRTYFDIAYAAASLHLSATERYGYKRTYSQGSYMFRVHNGDDDTDNANHNKVLKILLKD